MNNNFPFQLNNALFVDTSYPSIAAKCLASITIIELLADPQSTMLAAVVDKVTISTKTVLSTIRFICQNERALTIIDPHANMILSAIELGLAWQCSFVRREAVEALRHSLSLRACVFNSQTFWGRTIVSICEYARMHAFTECGVALKCLTHILSFHFAHIKPYLVELVLPITFVAVRSEINPVAWSALHLWSTLLKIDHADATAISLAEVWSLLPAVWTTFSRQEERDRELYCHITPFAWHKAKRVLAALCRAFGIIVIPQILDFIQTNIHSPDWRFRTGALITLNAILLSGIQIPVDSPITVLINEIASNCKVMIEDRSPAMQAACVEFIGRIIPLHLVNDFVMIESMRSYLDSFSTMVGVDPWVRLATNRAINRLKYNTEDDVSVSDENEWPKEDDWMTEECSGDNSVIDDCMLEDDWSEDDSIVNNDGQQEDNDPLDVVSIFCSDFECDCGRL